MAVAFHVKHQALDTFIEEVAEAFYTLCPDEAAEFERIVQEESKSLVKASGMSRDGHFLTFCKIPPRLYSFIRWQGHKRLGIDDFFRDRKNYYRLAKIWTNCAIRRRRTPFFQVRSDQCPTESPSV